MRIDAEGLQYRELNERIRAAVASGVREIELDNVRGQRYIGVGLGEGVRITVNGVPGNDLAAFMNGAELTIHGNAQDGVGNTMNGGTLIIHGDAGDILGHAMRGGRIFVRGNVGYRAGIHMKAYRSRFPVVVVGGRAGPYLGEYMAGGVLAVLGLDSDGRVPVGEYVGTGMHGGTLYVRGRPEPWQVGREVAMHELDDDEWQELAGILADYAGAFGLNGSQFRRDEFVRLAPFSSRPYGTLYTY